MSHYLVKGMLAGLIAGVVMGIMIVTTMTNPDGPDTIELIAQLYGFQSTTAGFIAHLVHSALIGGLFGVLFRSAASGIVAGGVWGVVYGAIWWLLGPVIIMPYWLAGAVRLVGEAGGIQAAYASIPGHLVFGLILGILYAVSLKQRTSHEEDAAHAEVPNTSTDNSKEEEE